MISQLFFIQCVVVVKMSCWLIPVNYLNILLFQVNKKKGRGGWPKGRKRKPELLNLPPKAPATGYTLYLNEQRKLFKHSNLAFHEITKIIGNK